MRRIIHQLHQFFTFIDDGGAVAPGKNSSKEAGYFYILFLVNWCGIQMGSREIKEG